MDNEKLFEAAAEIYDGVSAIYVCKDYAAIFYNYGWSAVITKFRDKWKSNGIGQIIYDANKCDDDFRYCSPEEFEDRICEIVVLLAKHQIVNEYIEKEKWEKMLRDAMDDYDEPLPVRWSIGTKLPIDEFCERIE